MKWLSLVGSRKEHRDNGSRSAGDTRKLMYLMHHYSPSGASHFGHIIPLLNELSRLDVRILLLIESVEGAPPDVGPHVELRYLSSGKTSFQRFVWDVLNVRRASREGFDRCFVRISSPSAIAAMIASIGYPTRVFFWQSGTTIEYDRIQPMSARKVKWYIKSAFPSRLVWRFCHVFVTGPASMVDYYANVGHVKRSKIRVLHNDVALERFQLNNVERATARDRVRTTLGIEDRELIVLFVHRLSPVRRTLDYLPHALVELRNQGLLGRCRFLVAGGGADLPALKQAAAVHGVADRMCFIGDAPNLGIENLYAASDVFIQPSHAEGFPRVMIEAMAAGLPIVTTNAGGSGELLGPDQQAFVTDRNDPKSFGVALAELIRSEDLMAKLAVENLRVVEAFDTPVVAQMYRSVLFDD